MQQTSLASLSLVCDCSLNSFTLVLKFSWIPQTNGVSQEFSFVTPPTPGVGPVSFFAMADLGKELLSSIRDMFLVNDFKISIVDPPCRT